MDKATESINKMMGIINEWTARCLKLQEAEDPELKELNNSHRFLPDEKDD